MGILTVNSDPYKLWGNDYQTEHDYSKDYLTFEALEDGEFVYTICYGDDSEGGGIVYASAKLQYSFNGEDWFDWARPHEISESINVLANQKLYVRGYTQPLNSAITDGVFGTVKFSSTCRFNACGLLSSLLYGYDYTNKEFVWTKQPMKVTHFSELFINCDKLISAENLILPQELVNSCYYQTFYGCTSLTTAPELPATTLADFCYQLMFNGCTSLTTAPELPATTLVNGCYYYMFKGCTALTTAPELPATTLTQYCYYGIFQDCSNLNYIKAMFTTTPSSTYTYNWVNGVSTEGTFVKNSAATWNVTGINGIPTGWTVETASA